MTTSETGAAAPTTDQHEEATWATPTPAPAERPASTWCRCGLPLEHAGTMCIACGGEVPGDTAEGQASRASPRLRLAVSRSTLERLRAQVREGTVLQVAEDGDEIEVTDVSGRRFWLRLVSDAEMNGLLAEVGERARELMARSQSNYMPTPHHLLDWP